MVLMDRIPGIPSFKRIEIDSPVRSLTEVTSGRCFGGQPLFWSFFNETEY